MSVGDVKALLSGLKDDAPFTMTLSGLHFPVTSIERDGDYVAGRIDPCSIAPECQKVLLSFQKAE